MLACAGAVAALARDAQACPGATERRRRRSLVCESESEGEGREGKGREGKGSRSSEKNLLISHRYSASDPASPAKLATSWWLGKIRAIRPVGMTSVIPGVP